MHAAGAAGFEKSRFFWPNACYPLCRSDCLIPCKGTNENALFCFRAMAAEKGIFHREKSLSDVRKKATPPDAGLHSCTGGVFAVPLRGGGPFQDGQRWVEGFEPLTSRMRKMTFAFSFGCDILGSPGWKVCLFPPTLCVDTKSRIDWRKKIGHALLLWINI